MMSYVLTAHFLAAMPFYLSTCNPSSLSLAAKQTWQSLISLPQALQEAEERANIRKKDLLELQFRYVNCEEKDA